MISKVEVAHGGCIDEYLDELYEKNGWGKTKGAHYYNLGNLEVNLRPREELYEFCGDRLAKMWTGMTEPMRESIENPKTMIAVRVQCRKDEGGGRTYMLVLKDGYGWDSRVFLNPTNGKLKLDVPDSIKKIKD